MDHRKYLWASEYNRLSRAASDFIGTYGQDEGKRVLRELADVVGLRNAKECAHVALPLRAHLLGGGAIITSYACLQCGRAWTHLWEDGS